jgi:uncharacterized membrane protein YjjP (DUF1212 family)
MIKTLQNYTLPTVHLTQQNEAYKGYKTMHTMQAMHKVHEICITFHYHMVCQSFQSVTEHHIKRLRGYKPWLKNFMIITINELT